MHATSLENVARYLDRVLNAPELRGRALNVLDVGSSDVNGTYRQLFDQRAHAYTGVDLSAGPGVDVVLDDEEHLPFADASFDVVVSGQVLEHCPRFWLLFAEMARVLRDDGFLIVVAPSAGPIHRYPVDCYRFYPDAFESLAGWTGCHLLECRLDERGPWRDLVGVFGKGQRRLPDPPAAVAQPAPDPDPDPALERTAGSDDYLTLLDIAHDVLAPDLYLEIGVGTGTSLARARGRAIGVDPAPDLAAPPAGAVLVRATSDDAFDGEPDVLQGVAPDLVFIDGMHWFEFALRDFMYVERRAHPATVVVFDDVFPNHAAQATRERRTSVWCGDVWKVASCLRRHRPDLVTVAVDSAPAGSLIVGGLDPASRVLWDDYNPVVDGMREATQDGPLPAEVLERHGALPVRSPMIVSFLDAARAAREAALPVGEVRASLLDALGR